MVGSLLNSGQEGGHKSSSKFNTLFEYCGRVDANSLGCSEDDKLQKGHLKDNRYLHFTGQVRVCVSILLAFLRIVTSIVCLHFILVCGFLSRISECVGFCVGNGTFIICIV